jgi:hypothetical protein
VLGLKRVVNRAFVQCGMEKPGGDWASYIDWFKRADIEEFRGLLRVLEEAHARRQRFEHRV